MVVVLPTPKDLDGQMTNLSYLLFSTLRMTELVYL